MSRGGPREVPLASSSTEPAVSKVEGAAFAHDGGLKDPGFFARLFHRALRLADAGITNAQESLRARAAHGYGGDSGQEQQPRDRQDQKPPGSRCEPVSKWMRVHCCIDPIQAAHDEILLDCVTPTVIAQQSKIWAEYASPRKRPSEEKTAPFCAICLEMCLLRSHLRLTRRGEATPAEAAAAGKRIWRQSRGHPRRRAAPCQPLSLRCVIMQS